MIGKSNRRMIARARRRRTLGTRGRRLQGKTGRVREEAGRDPCVLSCSRDESSADGASGAKSMTTFLTRRPRTSALNTNIVRLMGPIITFLTQTWARLLPPMRAVCSSYTPSRATRSPLLVSCSIPCSGAQRSDSFLNTRAVAH